MRLCRETSSIFATSTPSPPGIEAPTDYAERHVEWLSMAPSSNIDYIGGIDASDSAHHFILVATTLLMFTTVIAAAIVCW